MLYTNPHINGLDYVVDTANARLYNKLCAVWGVGDADYNSFGRVYRNQSGDTNNNTNGYVPEVFYDSEYRSGSGDSVNGGMFFEDSLAVVSYFALTDPIKQVDFGYQANMSLMFFLNLTKIMPGGITDSLGQRLDDVCVNDVVNWFNTTKASGFNPHTVYKDIDKVLEKYSGNFKKDSLKRNMQPLLAFRIDMSVVYNPQLTIPGTSNPIPMAQQWHSITLFIKDSPDLSQLIPVGNGLFIQAEYSTGATLTPMLQSASNGYLAGRLVQLPFTYNSSGDQLPDYNKTIGTWTMTAPTQFVDGDTITITFLDDYGSWVNN